jgi:RimJ/RimL family protein N-acetyltransferase
MRRIDCVWALIRDDQNRVFVQHRIPHRGSVSDAWDLIGGARRNGQAVEQALACSILEATGWRLRRVEAAISNGGGFLGRLQCVNVYFLVDVDGDLANPRLHVGAVDSYTWIGMEKLATVVNDRSTSCLLVRNAVAKAVRTRITDRLRLEPAGTEHAHDLWALVNDNAVAGCLGTKWSRKETHWVTNYWRSRWEINGVDKWMAYHRASGAFVGCGGLTPSSRGKRTLELSWALRAEFRGLGYATEIGRAALRFAFDDLDAIRVIASTELHNQRSLAVMNRLGLHFTHETTERGVLPGRDGLHEMPFAVYALTRRDLVHPSPGCAGRLDLDSSERV